MKELLFLMMMPITACINNPVDSNNEFISFFATYNSDSLFQKASITFPLPVISDSVEIRKIEKRDWAFSPLIDGDKNRINIHHLASDTVIVGYSLEDTGIQVDHWFIRKNGIWSLVKVIDSSD